MAEKKLKTLQFEGLNTTYVLPEVDPTSSISGDAADAKIVGDHLTDINNPHGVTLEQLGASKTIVTDENEDGHIILKSYLSDNGSGNISTHISDRSNPHKVTAVQVGADVSGAAKQALEDAKGYTDEVITNLIGGAPDTLNTLQELAEAMEANVEVVDVLEKAITGKADNGTLTAHIDNKNNPHNVTIEQIGAAPASIISYTISPNAVGELDTLLKGVYNAMGSNTRKFIYANMMFEDGLSGGIWQITLAKTTNDYGFIIAESYTTNPSPLVKTRTIYGGSWGDWYDTGANAFAPSGYGLGEATRNIGDWNTELKNGWYFAKNNAPDNNYWHGFIATHPDGSMVQTVYRGISAGAVLEAKRTYDTDTGVFGEWEWVNPPMQLGVEYRTTERWNGKVVYTKLVNCGALPDNGQKSFAYCDAVNAVAIQMYGAAIKGTESISIPYKLIVIEAYEYELVIRTTENMGNWNGYVVVKYIKD